MPAKKKKATTKDSIQLERAPIIAVMGHVDHGKTSLLDAIRGTKVQAGEVGGITQNTRVHQINYNDQKLTFIDTPGHEAFSEMRSRGAKVTDIVLLVVAADDGVQPQTKESIKFALQAKVPIIVAINKIDLPSANVKKLKQQLTQNEVLLEEFGGDVLSVEVSALKGTGIKELLDSILLLAQVNEIKKHDVDPDFATAFVIESTLDKNQGPVSLVLLKSGNINKASHVVYEGGTNKVRDLLDEYQQKQETAEEGDPVWIVGIDKVLATGEIIKITADEKKAKELARSIAKGEVQLSEENEVEEIDDLDLLSQLIDNSQQIENIKYLNVVIKTDTQGTLEAVLKQVEALNDDEVQVKVIHSGTGEINENDIKTARTSRGIVIGFQIQASKNAEELAKKERVLVRVYGVIYELLDELAEVMDSLGEPVEEEIEIARAKVKKVFQLSNGQYVAGSEVTKGTILKGYKAYIERDSARLFDARINSLRKLKNEVKEVKKGEDCGILLDPNQEVQEGDEIVCFKIERI